MFDDMWDLWGIAFLLDFPKNILDNFSITLRYSNQLWGHKPFRLNNYLLAHADFQVLVHSTWNNPISFGWKDFILKEKIKSLKGVVIYLVFRIDSQIDSLREEMSSLVSRIDLGILSVDEIGDRSRAITRLCSLLRVIDSQ